MALQESAAPEHLKPGELFERRYRIIKRLGGGGFASVYLAEHVDLGHRAAIKLLERADSTSRFVREGRVLAELRSPNTVRILDFGRLESGIPYLVSEFVHGVTLRVFLRREGKLSWRRGAAVLRQLLTSLSEAHSRGIVHRDVKPANIMISVGGVVKLLDFGVAKVDERLGHTVEPLTDTGIIIGTPRYMAPELLRGARDATPTSDVFGVGMVAFEILTGEKANDEADAVDIIERHVDATPYELPEDLDIPDGLRAWVETALSKHPRGRFPDATIALQELLAVIDETEANEIELDTDHVFASFEDEELVTEPRLELDDVAEREPVGARVADELHTGADKGTRRFGVLLLVGFAAVVAVGVSLFVGEGRSGGNSNDDRVVTGAAGSERGAVGKVAPNTPERITALPDVSVPDLGERSFAFSEDEVVASHSAVDGGHERGAPDASHEMEPGPEAKPKQGPKNPDLVPKLVGNARMANYKGDYSVAIKLAKEATYHGCGNPCQKILAVAYKLKGDTARACKYHRKAGLELPADLDCW